MKLYYSNASPYSRKVRLAIFESGLESQLEWVLVNPFGVDTADLIEVNPLEKIPALLLDNGKALYDSPVICHFLDELADSRSLIPSDTHLRLSTLRWEALADGLTDTAYNLVMERRRAANEQSLTWKARWAADILRVLQHIEATLDELGEELTLAHLALASAIGYLDFRLPEALYESGCPDIVVCPNTLAWYEVFKTRPAMQNTQPHD